MTEERKARVREIIRNYMLANLDECNQHFEESGSPENLTEDEIEEAMA